MRNGLDAIPERIVLLSGRVASGKSQLSDSLRARYASEVVKTREIIIKLKPRVEVTRSALQRAGAALDEETHGEWIAAELLDRNFGNGSMVIVDSVRIAEQVEAIRKSFGALRVTHIHVRADQEILAERYDKREHKFPELPTYEDVERDPTEAQVDSLQSICDVLIDTGRSTGEDVLVRAAARIGLYVWPKVLW